MMKKMMMLCAALLLTLSMLSAKEPTFQYGPWIQAVTDTGFTVLFKTSVDVMAWVEVAPDDGTSFELKPRKAYYQRVAGRRYCGRMHSIRITGLEPGTTYRYRIYRQKLEDASNNNAVHYTPAIVQRVGKTKTFRMKTFNASAKDCKFTMVCDIHQRSDLYKALLGGVKPADFDFLLLNGDIVNATVNIDTSIKYTFEPIRHLSANMPVVFVRGNHEGRGMDWKYTPEIFPTSTGEFYYTFRQGPVAFVVLDAGEDKPDSDVEYAGHAMYDDYRQEELEWLKEAVKDPSFAQAPYKVCLMHIPAINDKDSWYAQEWANRMFVPVLNEAGVNLMLSGHHHNYLIREKGVCGNSFPIIANDDEERMDVTISEGKGIDIRIVNAKGETVRTLKF